MVVLGGVAFSYQRGTPVGGWSVRRCSLLLLERLGFGVLGFGFWVLGFGFWVLGFGFWVWGFVV